MSVLTGLQAARALADCGRERAIYWTQAGEGSTSSTRARRRATFADGTPAGAKPLRLVAGDGGGFVAKAGARPREAAGRRRVVNCCHGGPVRTARCKARSTSPASPTPVLRWRVRRSAWTSWRSARCARGRLATLPRAALAPGATSADSTVRTSSSPASGARRSASTSWPTYGHGTDLLNASPHLAAGAVIEPYRRGRRDLNVAVRTSPS